MAAVAEILVSSCHANHEVATMIFRRLNAVIVGGKHHALTLLIMILTI